MRYELVESARSGCAINAAVEAFGDSWSLLVLRDVMFGNRRYFRELLTGSEERIASNILADRLKRLVKASLLTREDAGPGRRAAYSLTESAIQLVPIFAHLGAWGMRHRPTTPRLRARAELLADGGPELWDEYMAELRTIHLGQPAPERDGPSVMERLAAALGSGAGQFEVAPDSGAVRVEVGSGAGPFAGQDRDLVADGEAQGGVDQAPGVRRTRLQDPDLT
ncbi:winged helix-turn-helix transcriptional regulator [Acrocarpospora corrugata]|uniref:winged helix-turn-helix transcriptional regulator n=1 Tax=Acrocarpospora corrugata TaxID=35763 RepID=UPI001C3F8E65